VNNHSCLRLKVLLNYLLDLKILPQTFWKLNVTPNEEPQAGAKHALCCGSGSSEGRNDIILGFKPTSFA
jgi:hypothetical protein